MPTYIDFSLSENQINQLLEYLECFCERSDDFMEIENAILIINNLNLQRNQFYERLNANFQKQINGE